jgi:hypothetical protein
LLLLLVLLLPLLLLLLLLLLRLQLLLLLRLQLQLLGLLAVLCFRRGGGRPGVRAAHVVLGGPLLRAPCAV